MEAMNIDLKRMPLGTFHINAMQNRVRALNSSLLPLPGKLSKAQISQGYTILQQISSTIEEIAERSPTPDPAPSSSTATATKRGRGRKNNTTSQARAANVRAVTELQRSLRTLSSDFYTLIPHDFGRSLPPAIESMESVKEKLDLLEMLSNVEISQGLEAVEKAKKENMEAEDRAPHPLDTRYEAIQANMEPVDPSGDEFKLIERCASVLAWGRQSAATVAHQTNLSNVCAFRAKQIRDHDVRREATSVDLLRLEGGTSGGGQRRRLPVSGQPPGTSLQSCRFCRRSFLTAVSLSVVMPCSSCGMARACQTLSGSCRRDCASRHPKLRQTAITSARGTLSPSTSRFGGVATCGLTRCCFVFGLVCV